MTDEMIDANAKALYDACPTVKPLWHQLGDVTKGVWRAFVRQREGLAAPVGAAEEVEAGLASNDQVQCALF